MGGNLAVTAAAVVLNNTQTKQNKEQVVVPVEQGVVPAKCKVKRYFKKYIQNIRCTDTNKPLLTMVNMVNEGIREDGWGNIE